MRAAFESLNKFKRAVASDYEQLRRYQAKYHTEQTPTRRWMTDFYRKIGVQMTVAVRAMQAFDDARVPVLPQLFSRVIRHVYGAEIHWKAKIDPGLTIIHGTGLVISHAATIGSGCILFHNVTLGESFDSATQRVGAPTLGRDVHVGPGATLLGPITVGDRSKILAGAIVTRSVPADSLVKPAEASVVCRHDGSGDLPQ